MHHHTIGRGITFKTLEVVGQVRQRVFFNLRGRFTQLLPLGEALRHTIALRANGV